MTSLVAIALVIILTFASVAFLVAKHSGRGRLTGRVTVVAPALVVLFAVFAVYVAAWMLAVLLAKL